MKKIVVVLLTVMCFSAFGQSKSIKEFREEQEPDRVFVIYKSMMRFYGGLLEGMSTELKNEVELPDMEKLLDGMNEITVFIYGNSGTMKTEINKLKKDVMAEGYEVLMSSNVRGNHSAIMQKSKGDKPTDFAIIISSPEGVQLVDIDGATDFDSLQQLVKYLNGLDDPLSLLGLPNR